MKSILDEVTGSRAGRDDRILIAAIGRTGSTWLVNALANTPGTESWPEPDNIDANVEDGARYGSSGFGPYPVLTVGDDGGMYRALWDVIFKSGISFGFGAAMIPLLKPFLKLPKSILGPIVKTGGKALTLIPSRTERNLVKTIYGCFSLEWLVDTYDPRVIVTQRHPLSVIASWRDVDMAQFDLITRPELLSTYGNRYEGDPPSDQDSNLTRIAWIIGLLTTVMGDMLDRHPEWLLVNHEDMCIDPVTKFRALCEIVGIPWSERVAEYLTKANRPGEGFNPERIAEDQVNKWRSVLSPEEVQEAVEVLRRFPRMGWIRRPEEGEDQFQL